jgi:hypothetical protein
MTQEADLGRAMIIRPGEQIIHINLQQLLEEGDVTQNKVLKPGDVLVVREAGKITVLAAEGEVPVSEETKPNSYVLVMPRRVTMTLSIGGDNPRKDWYHIVVRIIDKDIPNDKVQTLLKPTRTIHHQWLARYRYQFTFLKKNVGPAGNFASATVRLDVFGPRE